MYNKHPGTNTHTIFYIISVLQTSRFKISTNIHYMFHLRRTQVTRRSGQNSYQYTNGAVELFDNSDKEEHYLHL